MTNGTLGHALTCGYRCAGNDSGVVCGRVCVVSPTGDQTGHAGAQRSSSEQVGQAMASTQRTIEAVELDSRAGLHCDRCMNFAVVAVRCSIVDSITLEHQRYATGSLCLACGAEAD